MDFINTTIEFKKLFFGRFKPCVSISPKTSMTKSNPKIVRKLRTYTVHPGPCLECLTLNDLCLTPLVCHPCGETYPYP